MKPADRHLHSGVSQRPGDIERPRELVGLYADQHHQRRVCPLAVGDHPLDVDFGIGFVNGLHIDVPFATQRLAVDHVPHQPMY